MAQHLVPKVLQGLPHIFHLVRDDSSKERDQIVEFSILHVIIPSRTENSIVILEGKVVGNIVEQNCSPQVSSQLREILSYEVAMWRGMLSIQPIFDEIVLIYLIKHRISIILHSCCEDYHLKVFAHLLQELKTPRSNQEMAIRSQIKVMHECLIQIQHECICCIPLFFTEWW